MTHSNQKVYDINYYFHSMRYVPLVLASAAEETSNLSPLQSISMPPLSVYIYGLGQLNTQKYPVIRLLAFDNAR